MPQDTTPSVVPATDTTAQVTQQPVDATVTPVPTPVVDTMNVAPEPVAVPTVDTTTMTAAPVGAPVVTTTTVAEVPAPVATTTDLPVVEVPVEEKPVVVETPTV